MTANHKWILLAEDNANDADLAMRALATNALAGDVVHANDGAEAMDCLYRRGSYRSRDEGYPSFVLLDLKMPRVDGFDVLKQMKNDARLKIVPVVIFTSSSELADIARGYELGSNAYVVKPVGFQEFADVLRRIKEFWLNINESPPEGAPSRKATATSDALAAVDSPRSRRPNPAGN